jgi:hypothetical protein
MVQLSHLTCEILVVELEVLPALPLQRSEFVARPNEIKDRGRPPRSCVFTEDDIASKITPVDL